MLRHEAIRHGVLGVEEDYHSLGGCHWTQGFLIAQWQHGRKTFVCSEIFVLKEACPHVVQTLSMALEIGGSNIWLEAARVHVKVTGLLWHK